MLPGRNVVSNRFRQRDMLRISNLSEVGVNDGAQRRGSKTNEKLYHFEPNTPNTLCFKANCSLILKGFKSHILQLVYRCGLHSYCLLNAHRVKLQVKN
jgi:hypothetical protein